MNVSRRELPKLAVAAAAAPQAPPSEDLLAAARENLKRNAEMLAKVPLPVETEPAFQFKP